MRKATGLFFDTMTKLRKDEDVSMNAIKRICKICKCNIGDIMDVVFDEECDEDCTMK